MHRSKLSTFVIDCKTDDLDAAAQFWATALRRTINPKQPGFDRYRDLATGPSEPLLLLQQVEHDSRVHLDIETDDVEAEVARLASLGAKEVERVRSWVVMEAPTGHRFCVVREQRPTHVPPPFDPKAEHARLASLAGHHRGRTRTFLDPSGAPDESDDTLYVEPVLGGRWVRMQWFGSVAGKARQGELLLGFHVDAREHELSWVDTFHTGTAMSWSRGAAQDDGVVRVLGSYAAGEERWGWRTELHRGDTSFTLRAFNISPAGGEQLAIETEWKPTP